MVVRDTLDNGLRLLTESIPYVRSVSFGVWLARGSRQEGSAWPGIAHFVEHMLFKGSENRSAEAIAQPTCVDTQNVCEPECPDSEVRSQ